MGKDDSYDCHSNDFICTDANGDSLHKSLVQSGLMVHEGILYRTDFFKLYTEGKVNSCNGNNAQNPYFSCAMPPSPGQTCNDYIEVEDDKCLSFRLRPDEAIVLVGKTPPEMKYFSYVTFLSTRKGHYSRKANLSILPMKTKPVHSNLANRETLFSSLGDTINNHTISTPGTPGAMPGNPFEQLMVVIFTACKELEQMITKAAINSGYPASAINTRVIPIDILNLGTREEDDTISIGHRIAKPTSQADFEKYLGNTGVKVFRVTPREKTLDEFFPVPFLTPRGDGRTEESFSKSMNELRKAIIEKYNNDYIPVELQTNIWLNESYEAIQQNLNNLGESRDTTYLGTDAFILPKDAFVVVYGVNHAHTGKCTYCNAIAYGNKLDNGVAEVSNEEFKGSASEYISGAETDYLYAWKFAYDPIIAKRLGACTEIPNDVFNPEKEIPYCLEVDDYIYFGFRAYVEPTTKVGPAWHELLFDRAIVFVPKTHLETSTNI